MVDQRERDEFDERLQQLNYELMNAEAAYDEDHAVASDNSNALKYYVRDAAAKRLPGRREAVQRLREDIEACKREAFEERSLRVGQAAEARRDQAAVEAEKRRDVEVREALAREMSRAVEDDANFWFRRFMLSLQIGNGAGFVALAGGVLQADDMAAAARLAYMPCGWFACGLVLAGLIPALLTGQRLAEQRAKHIEQARRGAKVFESFAGALAIASALMFGFAVYDGVVTMARAAHTKPAPAEQAMSGQVATSRPVSALQGAPGASPPRP